MIKKWKRIAAIFLSAFLLVQGTPQMVIAAQMQQSAAMAELTEKSTETIPGETEKTGSTEGSVNTENTESTEKPTNTENTESTEKPTNTENTESTEKPTNTENTESTEEPTNTENTENTEKPNDVGNTESNEKVNDGTEATEKLPESTENTENTEIPAITRHIKLVLAGPDNNSTVQVQNSIVGGENKELKLENGNAVNTTITIGEGQRYQMNFFKLNGMKITAVKWSNGQDVTGKLKDDVIEFTKEEIEAVAEESTLTIQTEYRLKVRLQCNEEDIQYAELSGEASVNDTKQTPLALQGITSVGVPLSLKNESAFSVQFTDLNGMEIEDVFIQKDDEADEEIAEDEWEKVSTPGCSIQFSGSAVKKLSTGSYTIVINVRILDAFNVRYDRDGFINPGTTILNKKYGSVRFEQDAGSKKCYMVVTGEGDYFAKQVGADIRENIRETPSPKWDENGNVIGIKETKFEIVTHSLAPIKQVTIQMQKDEEAPIVEIGGKESENGVELKLYKQSADSFELIIKAKDDESGIESVKYRYNEDAEGVKRRISAIGDDCWKLSVAESNISKPFTLFVSDYYQHTVTIPVKIVVDNNPPEFVDGSIRTEGIKVTKCTSTTYWQQNADTAALTFDIKEENGPVTAKYTICKVGDRGEEVLSDAPVICTLEDIGQMDATTKCQKRKLKLDFAAACVNAEKAEGVETITSLNDLADGKYVIKAKFNDASMDNETKEEVELARFEINTKKPILTVTDDVSKVQWISNPSEAVTVKADIESLSETDGLWYAVTYVTGSDADTAFGEAEILAPEDEAWTAIDSSKMGTVDGEKRKKAEAFEYQLPVQEITTEGTVKFYLWVKDGINNQAHSEAIVYNIDNTQPDYSNFKVTEKLNPLQRAYRYIFGTFLNGEETLDLSIDAKDPCPEDCVYASEEHQGDGNPKVTKVKLYYIDKDDTELEGKNVADAYDWLEENKADITEIAAVEGAEDTYTAQITVKEDSQFYKLYFAAEDKAGNISIANVAALDDGSGNYKITRLMVDKERPVVTGTLKEESAQPDYEITDGNKPKRWYAGSRNMAYDVTVEDKQSGIFSVSTAVNGEKLSEDANGTAFYDSNLFYQQKNTDLMKLEKEFSYVVNLNQGKVGTDGKCTVAIETVDNAGNMGKFSDTVYVDKDAPVITHMDFDTENKDELTTVPMQYGYFFQKAVKATVYATDYIGGSKEMGSGVAKFVYQMKPADGKPASGGELVAATNTDGTFSAQFTIPAGFKGQIEVKAIDNVGQDSGYYNPKGTVVETPEEHKKTSGAEITLPETSYKDSEGNPLYAANVQLDLLATDSRSGLKQSDWSVKSHYASTPEASGSLQVSSTFNENSRTWSSVLSGDADWSVPGALDLNLVTQAKKSINVDYNTNHIEAELEIMDNAGNTSKAEKQIFSVDKTAPVIKVEYDNNQALNDKYYKEKRVATVTVIDANFSEKDCVFEITGPQPKISEWSHQAGGGCNGTVHTDSCTYQCQVEFAEDGDYSFGFHCTDLAGHSTTYESVDEFTVDTKEPVITVNYDNNSAVNGNYYNEGRRATIEIEDKNFNPTETKVDVTASLDGAAAAVPQVPAFTKTGDIWSATVNFTEDGDYSLHVAATDLAGNEAEEYALEEFTVDKTAPEVTIGGVEDHSANKGAVAPTIQCEDINMDNNSFYIHLTGANHGETAFNSVRSVRGNSLSVSMADFAYVADADDLYTLEVGVSDQAGNETVESIMFSVNRFGSVYILEDATKNLMDKFYTNKEQDIVITEVNVDTLQYAEIDYSLDGDIITLQKDRDYTVTSKTGDASWKMYEYRIRKENFVREGSYVVSVYSEDLAQNKSSNKAKGEELAFVVDKTAPSIVVAGVENHGQYVDAARKITVDAQDNILLESVEVYVGNQNKARAGQAELLESNGQISLSVPSANQTQELYVIAEDAAGNIIKTESYRFLITKNLFVQWYSNVPLCVGSSTAAVSAAGFVLFRKRIPFKRLIRRI